MTFWKNYYLAENVSDALQALAAKPGPNKLIAGGTDLLLDIQQGRHGAVDTLVDISYVPEMNAIELRSGELYIGASVPLNKIVASEIVQDHAQALVEACSLIGGPQVRNTATLGGNVAHALPAGDGTIALLALDAQAEIASNGGRRQHTLVDLFLGPGKSSIDPLSELLVGFYLPYLSEGTASAFRRVMRPQGVAIAILNMALWLKREGDIIRDARLSVGPSGPTPRRASKAEATLRGSSFDGEVIESASQALLSEARFRTSRHRATEAYRRHLASVLLAETLQAAWERAGESEGGEGEK